MLLSTNDDLTSFSTLHPCATFAEQFEEGRPGQGASDLQPLGHHGRCDELVVRDFFVQLVISRLVEEDQVVELVPHLSFGPLLLKTKNRKLDTDKQIYRKADIF